MSEDLNLNHYV